jgi:hypothetical protein
LKFSSSKEMQKFFEPIKELSQNGSLTHVKILCVRLNLILTPYFGNGPNPWGLPIVIEEAKVRTYCEYA